MNKRNEILDVSFNFSVEIVNYCEIPEALHKYVIARQLLKSGTSIGACIREAQNAESQQDFIHKLKLAAKEAVETEYWLLLCQRISSYPPTANLSTQIVSIKKLLNSIIGTMKRKPHQK
jgi:four helix bundle protein